MAFINTRALIFRPIVIAGLIAGSLILCAAAERTERNNAFFAFDNGVGRGEWSAEKQAKVLKKIGYDGIGYSGTKDLKRRVEAFEKKGLQVFNLYVACHPANPTPYPDDFKEAFKILQGSSTMLWLTVQGKTNDDQAARVIGEIADEAARRDVKVALYPHYGFYVATARDALRLVKKVDRENVGVTINLCHELRSGQGPELDAIIKETAPKLFLVSINGADEEGESWDQLIQTLDKGSFDTLGFLKKLKAAGYEGPIGLQCYNIKGDPEENLKISMNAWRAFQNILEKGESR